MVLGSASLNSMIFFIVDSCLIATSIMFSFLIILGGSKFFIIKFASGRIDVS